MSNPVKYEDLVQGNALNKIAEDARTAIVVLNALIDKQKLLAKENNKPSGGGGGGVKDEKDQIKIMQDKIKVIEKADEVHKEYIQTKAALKAAQKLEDDAIKASMALTEKQIAQQQIDKANQKDRIALLKAEKIEMDKTIGTLQRMEAANARLRIERKNINTDTAEGRKRLQEINAEIDKNNKYIVDNSDKLKQQKLNVGGYKDAIKEAANELGIFDGELGKTLSFLKSQIDSLKASKAAMEEQAIATKGAEAASSGWNKTLGAIKLSLKGLGLAALIALLGSIAASFKTTEKGIVQFEAVMNSIGAIIKVFIGRLGQFGSGLMAFFPALFKDISNGFVNLKNEIMEFFGATAQVKLSTDNTTEAVNKMKTAFVGMGEAISKTIDLEFELAALRRQNRKDNLKDLEIIRIYKSEAELLNQIANDQTLSFKEREDAAAKALLVTEKSANAEIRIKRRAVEEAKKELEIRKLQNEDTLEAQEHLLEALDQLDDAETQRELLKLQGEQTARTIRIKQLANQIQLLEQTFDKEKELREKDIQDQEKTFAERQKLADELDALSKEKYDKEVAKVAEATGKIIDSNELMQISDEETLAAKIKSFGLGDKAEDLLLKAITNRKAEIKGIVQDNKKINDDIIADLKKQAQVEQELFDEEIRGKKIILDFELKNAEDNFQKQKEIIKKLNELKKQQLIDDADFERKKVNDDKTLSEDLKAKKILLINEKLKNDLLTNEQDLTEKLKAIHDKEIDEALKTVQQITKGISEGMQKRSEIQQLADQKAIDQHKRSLDVQLALAAAGKDNVLAQELAAATKAEEKKLQDEKKAAKRQETLALIDTFSKTLAAALKSGKPFLQAFGEALASEGVVSATFSKLFAGYKDGVEGIQGAGTETSDSIPVMLSKNESVATAEATKENPGLVTAMNKGMVDEYVEKMYLPQYHSANSSSTIIRSSVHDEKLAEIIDQKFDSLQQTIERKPVQQTNLGRIGEWHEKIMTDTMTFTINHKRNSTRPSLRLRV